MSPERWQRVEAALDEVLDAPPAARPDVLARICREHPDVGAEVRALVAAHEAADSYLEDPANAFAEPLLDEAEVSCLPPARDATVTVVTPPLATAAPSTDPPPRTRAWRRPAALVALALAMVLLGGLAWWLAGSRATPDPRTPYPERLLAELAPLFGEPVASRMPAGDVLTRGATLGALLPEGVPEHAPLATTIAALAVSLGRYEEADSAARAALRAVRQGRPDDRAAAAALTVRAAVAHARGDSTSARSAAERAVALLRRAHPDGHADLAAALTSLAVLLGSEGSDEARSFLEEALTLHRLYAGSDDPHLANTLNTLGYVAHIGGDLDAAEGRYREALALFETYRGHHPRVLATRANLAALLHERGRADEARVIYRDVLAGCRVLYDAPHPQTGRALYNLAVLEHEQGRHDAAEAHYREALAVFDATLPPTHDHRLRTRTAFGRLLESLDRSAEAEALRRDS